MVVGCEKRGKREEGKVEEDFKWPPDQRKQPKQPENEQKPGRSFPDSPLSGVGHDVDCQCPRRLFLSMMV